MHNQYRLRAFSEPRIELPGIDVERVRIDIYRGRLGALVYHRKERRHVSESGHHDLVPGSDRQRREREMQRSRTVRSGHAKAAFAIGRELLFEERNVITEKARNGTLGERIAHASSLAFVEKRLSNRDTPVRLRHIAVH